MRSIQFSVWQTALETSFFVDQTLEATMIWQAVALVNVKVPQPQNQVIELYLPAI